MTTRNAQLYLSKNFQLMCVLKNAGYSLTPARREVYQMLSGTRLVAAAVIQRSIWQAHPVTIRRTLTLFCDLGIARQIMINGQEHYELTQRFARQHHHRMHCEGCGRITGFYHEGLERQLSRVAERWRWRIHDHQIEIVGWCPDCIEAARGA